MKRLYTIILMISLAGCTHPVVIQPSAQILTTLFTDTSTDVEKTQKDLEVIHKAHISAGNNATGNSSYQKLSSDLVTIQAAQKSEINAFAVYQSSTSKQLAVDKQQIDTYIQTIANLKASNATAQAFERFDLCVIGILAAIGAIYIGLKLLPYILKLIPLL